MTEQIVEWVTREEDGTVAGWGSYKAARDYADNRKNNGKGVTKVYLRRTTIDEEEIW